MRIRQKVRLGSVLVLLSGACACTSSGNYDLATVCSSDAMTATVNMVEDPPLRCDCSFKVLSQMYDVPSYEYVNGSLQYHLNIASFPTASSGYGMAYLEPQNPNPKGCVLGDGSSDAGWITGIYATSQPGGQTNVSFSYSTNPSSATRTGVIQFYGTEIIVTQPGRSN